jgi:hypothetical protein
MSEMKAADASLRELARELAETAPEAIDCETTLDRIAAYLEAQPAGEPLPLELEQVRLHLAVCPACLEELNLLIAALGEA